MRYRVEGIYGAQDTGECPTLAVDPDAVDLRIARMCRTAFDKIGNIHNDRMASDSEFGCILDDIVTVQWRVSFGPRGIVAV